MNIKFITLHKFIILAHLHALGAYMVQWYVRLLWKHCILKLQGIYIAIIMHDEAKEKQSLCKNKLIILFITGILKLIINLFSIIILKDKPKECMHSYNILYIHSFLVL